MSRPIPPLPAPNVPEFIDDSMTPTWRGFWLSLLAFLAELATTVAGAALLAANNVFAGTNTFNGAASFPTKISATLGNFANDAAAAAGGVAIGQFYRNGNVVQVRIV